MTIVVVLFLGFGMVLVASALDCQPIIATFQKIVSGQTIDWTGQANCSNTQSQVPGIGNAGALAGSCKTSSDCPSGYTCVNGTCVIAAKACSKDSDCGSGKVCLMGYCVNG